MLNPSVLDSAPHAPGVYLMMDEKSGVIYVGKAKDLFKRLSSYVHHSGAKYNKTTVMLEKVHRVETIITQTEKEALILEASLIKKHRPRYNIILRDDKNYPFIKVTIHEQWPRVMMARRRVRDKARYFGPYSSASAMWATLRLISNLFPLRHCKGSKLRPRSRPCLNHQIGRCLAPCCGMADHSRYMDNVQRIILLLEGKNRDLIQGLEAQMHAAAEQLEFERAAQLRDQIEAVEKTLEKQVVSASHQRDQDVIGLAREGTGLSIAVLLIRKGALSGSRTFFITDPYGDDARILSQILGQFYSGDTPVPAELLLPCEPEDGTLHQERLSDLANRKVTLKWVQRGSNLRLVEMACANARQVFEEAEKKAKSWHDTGLNMQKLLHLETIPDRIECLDISNISGQQAVGSLVSFYRGAPDKKNFRHYRIKTVDGPNDYAMMREVLERRLTRGVKEDSLPDLFMVDGGRGQLGIAMAVSKDLGLDDHLELVGIAKEREEEGEKLYRPNRKNPVLLKPHNPVLLYLMRIRDESHRFGITFHRKLRTKAAFGSELDKIPGVGPARKKTLLSHLGSLKRVREASVEELMTVKGVGKPLALDIYNFFHPE